jgi:hypothetical protein
MMQGEKRMKVKILKEKIGILRKLLRQAMPYIGAEYGSACDKDAYKLYNLIKTELKTRRKR